MKTIILITIINLACFTVLNAQAVVPKYISEAVKSFDGGRYFEALPKLQSAYTKLGVKGKSISQKAIWRLKWQNATEAWSNMTKQMSGMVRLSN